ncbi:cadherin EGF LAG seven-pass G-type receptor 1 [Aplysia californica]|uniref:Cadherin EGF LAG seven-pass G-type receptor 1 n=1 Tax=Aplysia californica TaxID=6500 RepID=A0ABM1A2P5_APLCA|nr:cadherin EGF LAG seven-pass G-type receptor 1 [Aplysia californica]
MKKRWKTLFAKFNLCHKLTMGRGEHRSSWRTYALFFLLLAILCYVPGTLSYQVHLSSSDPRGSLLVNSTLAGHAREYRIERKGSKAVLPFISHPSHPGVVFLKRRIDCHKLKRNPLHFRLISTTGKPFHSHVLQNSSVIPYFVFVHGPRCRFLHREWLHKKIQKGLNQHKVFLYLPSSSDCLSKHHTIISLFDYIPSQYHSCKLQAVPVSPRIHVKPETLDLSFSENFCLSNELRIEVQLTVDCHKSHAQIVPYTLILRKVSTPAVSDHKALTRVRRQITNTSPSFEKDQYEVHVKEGQESGLPVITIWAKDEDAGEAGLLTYSMEADQDLRSQNMFSIDPTSGSIKTTISLDREFMSQHSFTITATDNALPESERRSATTYLTIIVDDVNDHEPRFPKQSVRIDVPESFEAERDVFLANAVDGDAGNNAVIRYSIINPGPPNDAFMINPQTGSISTFRKLDREKVSSYKLIVQAMDQGNLNERKSSTFTLLINVEDENDNSPQFLEDNYIVKLREDRPYSKTKEILNITALDADEGDNALISYRLSPESEIFKIDEFTGKLYQVKSVDYEDQNKYQLQVWAEDHGAHPKWNRSNILIEIVDVNDNKPRFIEPSYSMVVNEDITTGSSVLQVQAEDRDSGENARLKYSFVNVSQSFPFEIESGSGLIKTSQLLDREKVAQYKFVVKAADGAPVPMSASVSVTISLRDINDNPPRFEARSYNTTVSEEAGVGDPVETVVAVDPDEGDNGRLTYAVEGGNDRDAFSIRQTRGKGIISVKNALDARQQNKYVLTVTVKDVVHQSDSVLVYIDVLDTNRHRPVFQGKEQFKAEVSEDAGIGTTVFQVLALDSDKGENQRITYMLSPATVFAIDPDSGVITTRQKLDRDSTPAYILTVTAMDNGQPPLDDVAELVISVKDVNDNKPEFTQYEYFGNVTENSLENTVIMTIKATDKDASTNGQVTYTFDGGDDGGGSFSIDNQGVIRLVKKVDREVTPFYNLVAVAVDSHPTNPLSSSVVVHINVLDLNDNPPKFESSVFNVMIEENSPIGSTVAKIIAEDPDEGVNAQVVYSLMESGDSHSFQLSGLRGEAAIITTLINLDYDNGKKEYEVVLQAASGPKIAKAKVKIHVQDVNDEEPHLEDFSIIYNNFGGMFPSGPIGKVPAYDPDVSDRDKLVYKILSGNNAELIHLNESTGEITLDRRLDSDVPRSGTFQISVSDGRHEKTRTCWLSVRRVTMEMLHSAVTIRLDRMTQTSFLSPLMRYFPNALAHILGTDETDVFVINVEEDTDVPAQILNVSVSVRKDSVIERGQTRDVFFTPMYIREVIYLHRTLLANMSTLHVLPFDDNLCLREPCINNEACHTVVQKGVGRPFISSPTVLFRPVHPTQIFSCRCPVGFAGQNQSKMCDIEIDLCYSFPCQNNGLCLRHESGYTCQCAPDFTGPHCELNMTSTFTSLTCPTDHCHGPSHCVPLSGGGFVCDGCPEDDHHDSQCRLRTKNFQRGSYLTFPSLKARNRFIISMKFATQERNGLLLYNGRFNGEHDFIALEVVDAQVRFTFCLGSNVTTSVTSNVKDGVSTGEWVTVKVEYLARTATVTVGEDCDTEIVINYGDKLGDHSCAVRVEQVLDSFCDNPMNNCNRLLDLTGPMQIGGLPLNHNSANQLDAVDFVGCMSDIRLDHRLVDLDASIADFLTSTGCPPKELHCQNSPCKLGGVCSEGWNTYRCDCLERTGGKDCSQTIEVSRQLHGDGYLTYTSVPDPVVRYPWVNGIAFRTREANGALMQIMFDSKDVLIKIVDGHIHYRFGTSEITFDTARVDDGQWHYFEVRWRVQGVVDMFLDYGQYNKKYNISAPVGGKMIEMVYVGVSKDGLKPLENHFKGCVKDIRVGNTPQSLLRQPDGETNVDTGCIGQQICGPGMCGSGQCVDEWNSHRCECPPGTIGPQCLDVCTNFNPCKNWAECRQPGLGENSYRCECGVRQSGHYCENQAPLTCPTEWWGKPVCGPCHCDADKGFLSSCNKDNGTCSCKALHYLPPGGDTCYPCDCYLLGSMDMTCHPTTGQCKCHKGVVGRRCDQCDSIYAAVVEVRKKAEVEGEEDKTVVKCQVSYDDCPRNHASNIWWDPIAFGKEAEQDCPTGATGNARRKCTQKDSWHEADLFDCTSDSFKELEPQLIDFELNGISPSSADYTIELMKNISYTTTPIYGGDIRLTYRYTKVILEYEIASPALSMISQQYRDFVQKLLVVLSNVTDQTYMGYWQRVGKLTGGATHLLNLFEEFVTKIVKLLPEAQSGTFEAVSDDMVLGADWMSLANFSGATVPKYDNNVKKGSVDKEAAVTFPAGFFSVPDTSSAREKRQAAPGFSDASSTSSIDPPRAYVGYAVYRDFGKHISMKTDSSIRRTSRPMTVNSPMLTVVVASENVIREGTYILRFRLLLPNNRTNLHCARWVPSGDETSGTWTASGCQTEDTVCRVSLGSDHCEEYYVTCVCSRPSTFAVIIDVADGTALLPPVIDMEALSIVLTAMSLMLLLLSFFVLFTFKRLQCNWNSIRINIIFTLFIIELAYVIGINRTTPELFCRLVAISLHYFYMACFAWLFVEVLHIYRMLTEKQTINYGAMKFYYLLGYVLPGIVVGLAVGLYTDAYGNASFCWLSTSETFIWSFAGPVAFVVVLNVITFVFAARASCADKLPVTDVSVMRFGLLASILLLFLLSTAWVLGLLSVNYGLLSLHYLHAIFLFVEGIFVFLAYILLSKKVRWCAKRFYYRLKGKKVEFDENMASGRNSVQSRSALAYRHDSSGEGGLRINNVGISTTSTTSRSTKSSKGDKYLQSTSSSMSGGPAITSVPYGFESPFKEKIKEEMGDGTGKPGNDSDSDSDASMDRNSLELASSHSSDEDDEFDLNPGWENQVPKSKAVEQALEQIEKMKKDKERERLGNNAEDVPLEEYHGNESPGGRRMIPPPPLGPNPPDVTLSTLHSRPVLPPVRSDSLPYPPPASSPRQPSNTVQVLTHNGSISSDSESSETTA